MLDIQELFDNGFQTVQGTTLKEHISLIDKIKNSGILQNELNTQQVENLARYFVSLPDAVVLYFLCDVLREAKVENILTFFPMGVDNTSPSLFLHDILHCEQRREAAEAGRLNIKDLKS